MNQFINATDVFQLDKQLEMSEPDKSKTGFSRAAYLENVSYSKQIVNRGLQINIYLACREDMCKSRFKLSLSFAVVCNNREALLWLAGI